MRWPPSLWSPHPPPPPIPSSLEPPDADDPPTWRYTFGFDLAPPLLAVAATALSIHLYTTRLRRVPTTLHIPPGAFRHRTLFGVVTSVGDGDNFRLFHTPGGLLAGWHWLRRPPTARRALAGQTVHIRLAGVDAPERAHFGNPAQRGGDEAMGWLRRTLEGRTVRARVWRKDHYDRAVATVYVRCWGGLWRRDVGLMMLREGWASVYRGERDGEWGGKRAAYEKAEQAARSRGKGVWAAGRRVVLPGEWKKAGVGAGKKGAGGGVIKVGTAKKAAAVKKKVP
ncbi:hypothetical protein EDC01DRAFT_704135 [Geopyxis carbonaria]|nr:hypothetical protein EDC01DRAFT_704135 [Geopyxis carbonaria]